MWGRVATQSALRDKNPRDVAVINCCFFSVLPTHFHIIMSAPKGPFRLVTVNTAPERAKRLIGRVAESLKDRYTIIHVDNCESE